MSRAFVSEDSADVNLDDAPELKIPIPPGSRNYLAPEGEAALVAKLGRLETLIQPLVQGYQRGSIGASVRVCDSQGGVLLYRIVVVDEARQEEGLIGWTSPIARGLMGKTKGSTISIQLPESSLSLTILEIT
ncbi:MAG: GreA/GreB family elongation factor [Spirochaetes bacterium]|nr:GreA/GreB family elongation factor [Spirochaetota bacterium]